MASNTNDDRMDAPSDTCRRCRHFEKVGLVQTIHVGECRLRAPFIVGTPEFRKDITDEAVWYSTRWPIVAAHAWCGNWQAAKA